MLAADDSIVSASSAVEAMLGYCAKDIIGLKLYDFYEVTENNDHGQSLGVPSALAIKILNQNGHLVPARLSEQVLHDGEIQRKIVIVRTIVEHQKHIENAYMNEAFVNASYDGYWDWYIQDDYEYMSPRFWQILGFDHTEKKHHPSEWMGLIFKEDLTSTLENFDKHVATRGEHPFYQEVRYQHKDGSTVYIICRGQVIKWSEVGEPIRMIGAHTDITEQKKIEAALKAIEERFDVAVHGSSFGLWDWQIATGTVYWSPRFLEILGINDPDFTPTFEEFNRRLHEDERDWVLHQLNEEHLKNHNTYELEYRFLHEDGHYVWLHCRGQATWNEENTPVRMAGTIDDITQAKELEKLRAQTEVEFRIIVENSPMGMAIVSPHAKWLRINSKLSEILGFSESDLVNTDFREITHYDDIIETERLFSELKFGKRDSFQLEKRYGTKDGSWIWALTAVSAVSDEMGEIKHFIVHIDDITDRKKSQLALRDALNFQKLIFDSNPDFLFVKDDQFKIRECNPAFMELYPPEMHDKIIGYTTLESYDEEEANEFLENDRLAFKNGSSNTLETINFPNGDLKTLSTKKIRFSDVEGKNYILGLSRDVTEREALIRQLKRSNEELDEFAYIASHDLKEPLRGIHTHTQFLDRNLKDKLDDDSIRRLDRVKALTQHMEKLVSDLLYFSRVGRSEEAITEHDLQALIKDVVASIPQLEEDSVDVTIKPDMPTMECDGARVREVFRNLVTNAVKYNDSSQKAIEIGCIHQRINQRDDYVFYVRDNGIGIDPIFHSEIFHIFRRLHKKDAFGGGTGSGLTFVKKILDRQGGSIWVESDKGKGSTFYFRLSAKNIRKDDE